MRTLYLDGKSLSLDTFAAAAAGPVNITLAPAVRERLWASRTIVERYAEGEVPIYGLNTGLGGNLAYRIQPAEIPTLQEQIIVGRCVGVGEPLPEAVSRAAFLARIIGATRGAAGLSPSVLDLMMAMAARGLAPAIPSRGSIGAGDLALAAHMGATLLGHGEVWDNGRRWPAGEALRSAGLCVTGLGPKDALALANHSAVTVGLAALAVLEARTRMDLAQGVAVLSGEGYGMNLSIFDARLHALRPAAGQEVAAAWFRRAFEGSWLYRPGAARSIQDALSFRVLAPLFGVARAALNVAITEIETELNSAADNPAVLVEAGEILSTPNFHTPAIALALDTLAIAQTQYATASAQRVVKLMVPQLSGLSKYLSPIGGASAGFMPMQKTVAALVAEVRMHAQPASLDAMPVSEMVEDIAPQTPLTARKLGAQAEPLRLLTGIEAVIAAQAVDLRKPEALGRVAATLYDAIRSQVPPLGEDRATGPSVASALTVLEAAEVLTLLRRLETG